MSYFNSISFPAQMALVGNSYLYHMRKVTLFSPPPSRFPDHCFSGPRRTHWTWCCSGWWCLLYQSQLSEGSFNQIAYGRKRSDTDAIPFFRWVASPYPNRGLYSALNSFLYSYWRVVFHILLRHRESDVYPTFLGLFRTCQDYLCGPCPRFEESRRWILAWANQGWNCCCVWRHWDASGSKSGCGRDEVCIE